MAGGLFFIVYGDPLSGEDPVVSVRTATGHKQPTLLTQAEKAGGIDIRVIRSSWLQDDTSYHGYKHRLRAADRLARVSLACYSCPAWKGADVSAHSESQPWMWAWNAKQNFDNFAPDYHLQMHKHHAGMGGWGNFYVNTQQSISTAPSPPSLPPIRPEVEALGTSSTPMGLSSSFQTAVFGPSSFAHGLIMAIAFLLLFPAGIVSIRLDLPTSYKYHWVLQLVGSVCFLLGLVLGLTKGRKIDSVHQIAGLVLVSCTGIQGLLGWIHHVRFIRLSRRTWVSYAHVWLGRVFMIIGWANIFSGVILRGYSAYSPAAIVAAVCAFSEAVGITGWLFYLRRREVIKYTPKPLWGKGEEDAFVISSGPDEEVDEDEATAGEEEGEEILKKEMDIAES